MSLICRISDGNMHVGGGCAGGVGWRATGPGGPKFGSGGVGGRDSKVADGRGPKVGGGGVVGRGPKVGDGGVVGRNPEVDGGGVGGARATRRRRLSTSEGSLRTMIGLRDLFSIRSRQSQKGCHKRYAALCKKGFHDAK